MSLDIYKSQFDSFVSNIHDEPKTVMDARKSAFNSFVELGLPSNKHELWQFTDLSALTKNKYDILKSAESNIDATQIEDLTIPNSHKIVIENGILNNEQSDFDNILVKNTQDDILDNFHIKQISDNPFTSLNKAFVNGGYSIEISNDFNSEKPIHIINIISKENKYIQNHQLNVIKIGKNSSVSIIEEFIINDGNKLFNNIVNKIDLKDNSKLNYAVFQNNDSDLIKINNVFVQQENDSSYNAQFIIKNGSLIRNDINVQIDGENCETNISGLGLLDKTDHIENYILVDHNKPHCNSNQLFKYILKDSAEGVFNGLVKVQPDAQQTDSQQTNRNILLSKKALMNSNPQLEIYADDVKCAHGSATGELDDEAIFYLRSRGIDLMTAKSLLIEGFAKEVVEQINNDDFKNRINDTLIEWLSI